jgi:osmotically-inducible protein OsmY
MHDPARPRRSIEWLARTGLCAGVLLAAAQLATGVSPPTSGSRDPIRDLQVLVHARSALRENPVLASLNMGVRVHDGVATLWGPVPSADLIPKALKTLESVQGVLDARSELYVNVVEKPDDQLFIPLPPEKPTITESASPDTESGLVKTLTGRPAKSAAVPAETGGGTSSGVQLSAPIAIPDTAAPVTPAAGPVAPATQAAPAKVDTLAAAVELLRRGSPRFRTLRVEVRAGVVSLAGRSDQGEDVMALARAISLLPGVQRVLTKTDDGPAP